MSISKKIINSVVGEMIESAQDMGEIVIVPNTYDVYIHTEDFKDVQHFLHILREQIVKKLDDEVGKRSKSNLREGTRFASIFNKLLGFGEVLGKKQYQRVEEHWDINFQECDGKICIGDEVFELQKGEVCTVRNFSSLEAPRLDSQFGTVVTIYQADDLVKKSQLDSNEISGAETNRVNRTEDTPTASYFATLRYKYKDSAENHIYYMTKDRIIVGRQTDEDQVDLPLTNVSNHISRRHLEIRADDKTGKFFLKSMGPFGTTVSGVRVPDGRSKPDDMTENASQEFELRDNQRISLAGGEVIIDFSIG